jgi:hypothetical protein
MHTQNLVPQRYLANLIDAILCIATNNCSFIA